VVCYNIIGVHLHLIAKKTKHKTPPRVFLNANERMWSWNSNPKWKWNWIQQH